MLLEISLKEIRAWIYAKICSLCLWWGTDLQSIIDAKQAGKINGEIALVISNRQKAYGLQRAKDAGIETAVVKKMML